jgi:hypothetical protein
MRHSASSYFRFLQAARQLPYPSRDAGGGSGETLAPDDLDDDEPDFILEDDGTVVEMAPAARRPRMPAIQRLRRSTLAAALAIVAAVIALGGPGSVATLLRPLSTVPQAHEAVQPLNEPQSWSAIDAPAAAGDTPGVRIVPASGAAGMAYACWVNVPRPQLELASGPLKLAILDLPQHQWHSIAPPTAHAVRCDFTADAVDPQSALLILWQVSAYDASCQLPELYRTRDLGTHWTRVAWSSAALPNCDLTFRLVAGRIYVFSSASLLAPAALPPQTAGQIIVSDDEGHSWHAADTGLAGLVSLEVVAFRPGGHILAQGEQRWPVRSYSLLQTSDDGSAWQYLGRLPGTAPRVFASSNPSQTAGGWGPLYLSSQTPLEAGDLGSNLYFASARLPEILSLPLGAVAMPALRWKSIPPPDVPAKLTGRPFGTALGDAAEGPNGTFLYLQPVSNTTPYIIVPQYHVWLWDPARGVWTREYYAIPPNATLQGVSWGGAQMAIWLTTWGGAPTPRIKVQISRLGAVG